VKLQHFITNSGKTLSDTGDQYNTHCVLFIFYILHAFLHMVNFRSE